MTDASVLFAAAQALHRAGRIDEARERYEKALVADPHHGGALHMLGIMAFQSGDAAQAITLLTRAAAADPDVPSLHANLGLMLTAAGRLGEAEASHLKALALRPGDANTLAALAVLALTRGDSDVALQRAVAALTTADNPGTRRLFADIAGALRFDKDDLTARALLTRAITEAWGATAPLALAATGLVRARLADGGRIGDDALMRAVLAVAPVTDTVLEEALTAARRTLPNSSNFAFAAALAQQCFLNGYVFWQDEDETARVTALRARIEAALAAGENVPDFELAMLACYLPLHTLAGAEKITTADPVMTALLRQQRDEPEEEKRLAAALPALTPVNAPDGGADELYPRWSGTPSPEMPVSPRAYLVNRFPAADLGNLPDKPDMLVAGCGTGQYALQLARALTLGDVTAIDLDRAAIAYAARKALEAGMGNLRFGRGDILNVAAFGPRFGLIECGGVLHQLPDPLAGWAALLAVLQPGGLMRIAVHSAVAQQTFAKVRGMIAAKGFAATPDGIRATRRWLKERHDDSLKPVLEAAVFFTHGGCRHLLFPAGEQPLTFTQIAAFLARHDLTLIGLDVAAAVLAAYRASFPQDPTAVDLDNWASFEQENPDTFAAMIQFWVHKRG